MDLYGEDETLKWAAVGVLAFVVYVAYDLFSRPMLNSEGEPVSLLRNVLEKAFYVCALVLVIVFFSHFLLV